MAIISKNCHDITEILLKVALNTITLASIISKKDKFDRMLVHYISNFYMMRHILTAECVCSKGPAVLLSV